MSIQKEKVIKKIKVARKQSFPILCQAIKEQRTRTASTNSIACIVIKYSNHKSISNMLRDAKALTGASRETTYLTTLEEIVFHVNQNSNSSTCAGTRALEHVADVFASKQAWAHVHENYSHALQMIKNPDISAALLNESTSSTLLHFIVVSIYK
jgi:predicted ATP-dependent serine protease